MGVEQLLQLAAQFGPMGLLVGYLVWDKQRTRREWREHEERRIKVDEARIETDRAIALAMQALTFQVEAKR